MNSLPPLSLPRFHVNELSRTHKSVSKSVQTTVREEDFAAVTEETADAIPPEPEALPEPEAPTAPLLPEVDTGAILKSLEAAKADLEQTALMHSQQMISEFLKAGFPALCDALLAEEVVRATTAMAPDEITKLVVKVPPPFEPSFQRALQASPELSEVFELQPNPGVEDIIIDVDWQSGGLQFDMQQFLESSLARLAGLSPTQEGHNV